MKRILVLACILGLSGAAVWYGQHRRDQPVIAPNGGINLVADSERELSRVPMRVTRLSDDEEVSVGDEIATLYIESNVRPETQTQAIVEQVGSELAARAHRKLPYRFHLIDNPYFVNAFALPGGHVFIGRGLLDLMDTKDELAAVLGHEVEHIDHYHCAERVQLQRRTRDLPFAQLALLPVEIFQAGYGKEQELEADREGVRLAVLAGYSPQGAVRIFQKFDALYHEEIKRDRTPEGELSRVALQSIFDYFRSHPEPQERIAQLERLMGEEHWAIHAERPLPKELIAARVRK
jgi:predicted Zn-dependent protease